MWRLRYERGRQWWHYDSTASQDCEEYIEIETARKRYAEGNSAHACDEILRAQARANGLGAYIPSSDECDAIAQDAKPPVHALIQGARFFSTLQCGDGHWAGDYGGPMFLLPGLIIACHVSNTKLDAQVVAEMIRFLRVHQRPDGGYGLHIEHHSTMFGTGLNYVAMRLLGIAATDPHAIAARDWIQRHGGVGGIPGWGKFWLAVLGVYDWDGLDPLTPEFWLLPYALPVHPARFWCHCRVVYLPMSHLYGKRATGPIGKLVREIREELYPVKYADVRWSEYRGKCCEIDVYTERPRIQRLLWNALVVYEKIWFPFKGLIRRMALDETLKNIEAEDENTNYIDIGPVNKVINFLCRWFDDPESEAVAKHRERLKDYLWLAEDGMKMQGYNGSQLWDTAFTSQAFTAAGEAFMSPFKETLARAHHFIDITQVRVDVPNRERFYRHISKGAWPFSTVDHGWPIADCTGEGLKAALKLQEAKWIEKRTNISNERLLEAVDMILSYQNTDGGWATYELTRGPEWLEYLNPSEVFGNIMIDYSYVECSSSALCGLAEFRRQFPEHPRCPVIDSSIERGLAYIERMQRADGSWYGSWGVCFLYAAWFAVDAMVTAGRTLENCESMRKGCAFVASKQREDGSWGESYKSSQDKVYTQSEEGLVVSTGWALLLLSLAKWKDHEALHRAADFLVKMQQEDGDWPQQTICGVFNHNCAISYSQYRNIFPIWALAEYIKLMESVGNSLT